MRTKGSKNKKTLLDSMGLATFYISSRQDRETNQRIDRLNRWVALLALSTAFTVLVLAIKK